MFLFIINWFKKQKHSMSSEKINLTDAEKTLSTYRSLSMFLSKFGMLCICAIASFLFLVFLPSELLVAQESSAIPAGSKWGLLSDVSAGGISIKVSGGTVSKNNDVIVANNVYSLYSGFLLPVNYSVRQSVIEKASLFFTGKALTSFSTYDKYFTQWLFPVSKWQDFKPVDVPWQSALSQSNLLDTFSLTCLSSTKLIDSFCRKNVDNFLAAFPYYDLKNSYDELQTIFQSIDDEYGAKKCDALLKYSSRSLDYSSQVQKIFSSCPGMYLQKFLVQKEFSELVTELTNKTYLSKIYVNKEISQLKLLSFFSNIYYSFASNNADYQAILTYLTFSEQYIQSFKDDFFFIDLIYFYNNRYIASAIAWTNADRIELKDSIKLIKERLQVLNKWWSLLDPKFSLESIASRELIAYFADQNVHASASTPTVSVEQQFKSFLAQYPSFDVVQSNMISQKEINIKWKITISAQDQKSKVYTILLKFAPDGLNVDRIINVRVEWEDALSQTLASIVKQKPLTFNQLIELIKSNAPLSNSTTIQWCDFIKNQLSSISRDSFINSCDDRVIVIAKAWIIYEFTLQTGNLKSVMVSDKSIQSQVPQIDGVISGTALIKYIAGVLSLTKVIAESNVSLSTQQQISSVFRQFLWVELSDLESIGSSQKLFKVGFVLGKYNFVWIIDLQKNYQLKGLSFVDDLWESRTITIPVKGFTLELITQQLPVVNSFKLDPIKYIEAIDPAAVTTYKEKIAK